MNEGEIRVLREFSGPVQVWILFVYFFIGFHRTLTQSRVFLDESIRLVKPLTQCHVFFVVVDFSLSGRKIYCIFLDMQFKGWVLSAPNDELFLSFWWVSMPGLVDLVKPKR